MDTWLLTWNKKLAQISLLSKHLQRLQQTSAVLTTKEFKPNENRALLLVGIWNERIVGHYELCYPQNTFKLEPYLDEC